MSKTKICKYDKLPSQRYLDILEKNNMVISLDTEEWDVYFPLTDKADSKELEGLGKVENKYIGVVTGTDCMINRRTVWMNLVNSYGREQASRIMPETYILDDKKDIRRLKTDTRNHFILKDNRHRRLGLVLVDSVQKVLNEKEKSDIAQPLITNLRRHKGTSFNFRVYALLTLHKNKLTAYLYYEGVCIYGKPPGKDIQMYDRMITHARNAIPEEFPELMSELLDELEVEYKTFFRDLCEKINKLLDSAVHEFGKLENLEQAKCFQVFGIDILVDTNNQAIICEVNKGPSMKSKNENHGGIKNDMLEEMLSVMGLRTAENKGFIEISSWKIIT
ncbi:tubulin--tyrosine ligase family protein [Flavicella sediminum]|uniref:tubulin--tyrosine ligase family protein n=1 Tax=Flavicella sediminum TaxID=2585141 RepID=UPI00111E33A7|nr:tubulin--tyrosine ligase family protein [Flavicella sediminum]